MMIGSIFQVIMEHPLLTFVFIVDLLLILLIVSYVSSKLFGEKRPDRKLFLFFRRLLVKPTKSEGGIESLYEYVIGTYVHKGIVSHDTGKGFRARENILDAISDEEKRIVSSIFKSYEGKIYGGGLQNEEKTVSYLSDQFRAI